MTDRKKDKNRKTCGAKAKQSGEPCKLTAGFGTDHGGVGRCKYHGGCSPGAAKGNQYGTKHNLSATDLRQFFTKTKARVLETIQELERNTNPLKAEDIAACLKADAERLQAGVLSLEMQAAKLEADGRFGENAQKEFHRRVTDFERLLSKIRSTQTVLASRFGKGVDGDEDIEVCLVVPGAKTAILPAGTTIIGEGDPSD